MLALIATTFLLADLPPEIAKWEKDIAAFEKLDQTDDIPEDAVLYYGSSSMRLWKTIQEDMAPWPVIQRGYGGARYSDGAHYANRVVGPHASKVRAIVVFFANDIVGKDNALDVSPEEVSGRLEKLLSVVRSFDDDVPFIVIEVTPTPSRWAVWPEIARAGDLMKAKLEADPNAYFLPTAGAFLGLDGQPRPEYFLKDQLHLNETGYDIWSNLLKAKLHSIVGPAVTAE